MRPDVKLYEKIAVSIIMKRKFKVGTKSRIFGYRDLVPTLDLPFNGSESKPPFW